MGYYVSTTDCDFAIKRGSYGEAYRLLRALNARDELKRGRCHPASLARPEGSKSPARDPNVWFSWMPWKYDEVYGSAVEILRAVGFAVEEDEGGICFVAYDGKSGCEEELMAALAPVVERGSYIEWAGEEPGDLYRYEFDGARMRIFQGEVVWREAD